MNDSKKWLKKAKEDLKAAKINFREKLYEVAVFLLQQSVEKALKALLLEKEGKLIKTHDLVMLVKRLKVPKKIGEHAKELTLAYIYLRYPDLPKVNNLKYKTKVFLNYAESVVEWIEKSLQNLKNSNQE